MEALADSPVVSVLDFAGDWMMVRTKGQKEKSLCRELSAAGVPHFIPEEIVTKFYHRPDGEIKRQTYSRLLWPTYVFACGGSDAWYAIYESLTRLSRPEVIRSGRERFVQQLRGYQIAMESGAKLSKARSLVQGRAVRVGQGHPLEGLTGKVESFDDDAHSPQRVWLNMNLMGAARSVEIESSDWLEYLD